MDWEIISGKTRKIKEVVKSKSLKKQRPKKSKEPNVHKQGKPKTANDRSLSKLMERYKDFDKEIKVLEEEVDSLKSLKLSKSVEVAVVKAKLQIKSENVTSLKEKLSNMLRMHSSCNLAK